MFYFVAARRLWIKQYTDGAMLDIIHKGWTMDPFWTYLGESGIRFKGFGGIKGIQW